MDSRVPSQLPHVFPPPCPPSPHCKFFEGASSSFFQGAAILHLTFYLYAAIRGHSLPFLPFEWHERCAEPGISPPFLSPHPFFLPFATSLCILPGNESPPALRGFEFCFLTPSSPERCPWETLPQPYFFPFSSNAASFFCEAHALCSVRV